jgi:peroxiredoxin
LKKSPKQIIFEEYAMALKVGQSAPDFVLKSHLDREVRLSEYLGRKNVVLAFFPLAWTPV